MSEIVTPKNFTRRDLVRLASITIGTGAVAALLPRAAKGMNLGLREGAWRTTNVPPPPGPYDAEVEWVETGATNRAYIDTGVVSTYWDSHYVDVSVNPVESTTGRVVSFTWTLNQWLNDSVGIYGGLLSGNRLEVRFAYGNQMKGFVINDMHQRFTAEKRVNAYYLNGVEKWEQTKKASSYCKGLNYWLFSANDNNSMVYTQYTRYYSAKFYDDNGVLIRDFIPVRVGNLGTVYDKVNGVVYDWTGTPDVSVGPDKVSAVGGGV